MIIVIRNKLSVHFQAYSMLIKVCLTLIFSFILVSCSVKSPVEKEIKEEKFQVFNELRAAAKNNLKIESNRRHFIPADIYNSLSPRYKKDKIVTADNLTFDIAAHDIKAEEFFLGLGHEYKENILVHPDIKTKINLNLKKVTLLQVLEALRQTYNLDYKKTKVGYEISYQKLQTAMFTINKLNISRQGSSAMTIGEDQYNQRTRGYGAFGAYGAYDQDDGMYNRDFDRFGGRRNDLGLNNSQFEGRVNTRNVDHFWRNLRESILMIVDKNYQPVSNFQSQQVRQQEQERLEQGEKPSVKINKSSGLIIVRAYPYDLKKVAKFLHKTENILSRQVLIEAKFIEVTLNKEFGYGIDWSFLFNKANKKYRNLIGLNREGSGFQSNAGDPANYPLLADNVMGKAFGNVLKIGYFDNNITAAIDLLSSQGRVNVISSPRISTLNNQKAVIRIGDNSYFITGVQGNYVPTGQFTSGYENNINFQPFFSGVALDITPQITSDDIVTLHIHPKISQVDQKELIYTIDGSLETDGPGFVRLDNRRRNSSRIPTARTKLRESDTIVRAKSGEVIIIGGLMQRANAIKRSGLSPIENAANNYPGNRTLNRLNDATTAKADSITHTELVLLLRPIVIRDGTWSRELNKTANQIYKEEIRSLSRFTKDKKSSYYQQ